MSVLMMATHLTPIKAENSENSLGEAWSCRLLCLCRLVRVACNEVSAGVDLLDLVSAPNSQDLSPGRDDC